MNLNGSVFPGIEYILGACLAVLGGLQVTCMNARAVQYVETVCGLVIAQGCVSMGLSVVQLLSAVRDMKMDRRTCPADEQANQFRKRRQLLSLSAIIQSFLSGVSSIVFGAFGSFAIKEWGQDIQSLPQQQLKPGAGTITLFVLGIIMFLNGLFSIFTTIIDY